MAIDRHQVGRDRPKIDHEIARCGRIDDTQKHPPTRFDPNDVGIAQRPLIGQERIEGNVVQIHLHAPFHALWRAHLHAAHFHVAHVHPRHAAVFTGHARHRHAAPGRSTLAQVGKDFCRRPESEIVEHDHDLLLVCGAVAVMDDQRRVQEVLLLEALVGMHPECARIRKRKVVICRGAGRDQRCGDPRHPVLLVGRFKPVPVDERWFARLIVELDTEPRSNSGNKASGSIGLADPENARRLAIDLNGALLDSKDGRSTTFRPREPRPWHRAKSNRASGRYEELSAIEHRFSSKHRGIGADTATLWRAPTLVWRLRNASG